MASKILVNGKVVAESIISKTVEKWQDLNNHYVVEVRVRRERAGFGFYVAVDTATDPDGDFGYTESTIQGRHVPMWLISQALELVGLTVTEAAKSDVYCYHKELWRINPAYTGEKEA